MSSRFPKKLTLEEQRYKASILGRTEEETQEERYKKYGEFGETFKQAGNCFGKSCEAYRDLKAEYVDPHLVPVYENAKDVINKNMAECTEYTGDTLEACAARVKETARNAAEATGNVARNTAVAAHTAMERFYPQSFHVNRRKLSEQQQLTDAQNERDKQDKEFQLFVKNNTTGKTYTLDVHGYYDINNINSLLENKDEYNFKSFNVNNNGPTYSVDNNLNKTLTELNINENNRNITFYARGGTKKTKKRRKSTTTKRRKVVRRRKGTKRRV